MNKSRSEKGQQLSQQMKRAVEASIIKKAEAHTAAFKMINLNPTTYEAPKKRTGTRRSVVRLNEGETFPRLK
jgi:hypothetical protein